MRCATGEWKVSGGGVAGWGVGGSGAGSELVEQLPVTGDSDKGLSARGTEKTGAAWCRSGGDWQFGGAVLCHPLVATKAVQSMSTFSFFSFLALFSTLGMEWQQQHCDRPVHCMREWNSGHHDTAARGNELETRRPRCIFHGQNFSPGGGSLVLCYPPGFAVRSQDNRIRRTRLLPDS